MIGARYDERNYCLGARRGFFSVLRLRSVRGMGRRGHRGRYSRPLFPWASLTHDGLGWVPRAIREAPLGRVNLSWTANAVVGEFARRAELAVAVRVGARIAPLRRRCSALLALLAISPSLIVSRSKS